MKTVKWPTNTFNDLHSMITHWIMVGGCPRSGTTLLGNMLGCGQEAIVTPEAQFAGDLFRALAHGQVQTTTRDICDFIQQHWRYRLWDTPFPKSLPDLSGCSSATALATEIIKFAVANYAHQHGKPSASTWVDHTPEQLTILPQLGRSSLDLSLIHIVRDGRAIAASLEKVDWGPTNIISAAQWWMERVAEGFAAQHALPEKSALIRFEDLVSSPAAELQRICKVLPIDYAPEMLVSRALKVIDYTKEQHSAVGSALDPHRANYWITQLSHRKKEIFQSIAGNLLTLLGYERTHAQPRSSSFAERFYLELIRNAVVGRVRHAKRKKRMAR